MPNDWSVLGRSGDPAPGDPARVRTLAGQLARGAEQVERNTVRLRGIAANGGELRLEGDYASSLVQALGELPGELGRLGTAYRGCGSALSAYAVELEQAKRTATSAIHQGMDAHLRLSGAQNQIRSVAPPDCHPLATERVFRNVGQTETMLATINDDAIRVQVRQAVQRARYAESDRMRAVALANQAAELRGQAETKCVHGINAALRDSGIKNASWWKKAWDFMSAPFKSWDAFIGLCKVVAIVVSVLALIIGGPILGIILIAVGALILADTLNKYRQGKATLADVGLDLLGVIPGGKGLAVLGRLGMALRSARPIMRVVGPLRNAATALPHGLKIAQGLRGALTSPRLFGRAVKCRFVGRDPVDLASGEMILSQTDIELPAALPLIVRRTHTTSFHVGRIFGPSWSSPLDQRLEVDDTGVYFASVDGVLQRFPFPDDGETVTADEGPRVELRRLADETYTVGDPETGQILRFAEVAGAAIGMFCLVRIADRNGNQIDLEYDDSATLSGLRHSAGYHLDAITEDGLLTTLRLRGVAGEPARDVVRYGYNPGGMLTDIINSSDRALRFSYDDQGRIVRWVDRNDTWYSYTYDAHGRCVTTVGSAGVLNGTISYDVEQRVTVETDSLGQRTSYYANEALQIERVVNPAGHTTRMRWDRYDRLLSRTDPLGLTTTFDYDEAGNLTAVTRPDGAETTVAFNDLRLPIVLTGADGATWRHEYDARGNLISLTDPTMARTTWQYDDRGRLASTVDALGQRTSYLTDDAGLPIAITDPSGATTRLGRDPFGRVDTISDPSGNTTHLSWTVEGKLASRTMPDGATQRWLYDAEGNLIEHIGPIGETTRFEITDFDLPSVRTNPDGSRLAFTYDTELRLVAVTNPQGRQWRYEYDAAGNLVRETDFNESVITYEHDEAGRLVTRTNNVGETTAFVRDAVGNVVEQRAGAAITRFRYDPAGRLTRAENADAVVEFERDPVGRVLAETCNGRTVASSYDALGRRVSRTTPTGAQSTWDYGANGAPSALHVGGQTIHFGYDGSGREIERRFGAGVSLTQGWDVNSRLISQTITAQQSTLVQHRALRYREDGQVTAIHDHLAGTRHFDLDAMGRVTAVNAAGWSERYRYDAAGNVTEATWPSPTESPTESPTATAVGARQYAGTRVVSAGRVRYEHDAQGRVTLRQRKVTSTKPLTWRYVWNAEDRLVGVTTPDGDRWTYQYDPLGRRISKSRTRADGTPADERIDFVWDGTVLAEQTTTAGHTTTWDCEPGTFRPLSQTERTRPGPAGLDPATLRDAPQEWVDERFYAIVTDLVGTPTELVGTDGDLVWRPQTTLWGLDPRPAADGVVDCPLRFPGQYFDPETQLNYNYFRYYDPDNAQYLASDPIGLAGGANPHAYVPNPTTWLDPLGLAAGAYGGFPIPKIAEHGLLHSFDRHAAQWFGREVTRGAKLDEWRGLIERAAQGKSPVPWSSGATDTFGHLTRIDGKWFLAQFDRSSGDLVTAFVPKTGQLGALLGLLGK